MKNIALQNYKVAPGAEVIIEDENGGPVMAVKQCGKGRVVTCAWRSAALTPDISGATQLAKDRPYRYWEAIYCLMNRAVYWAAGREFKREGEPRKFLVKGAYEQPNFAIQRWQD